jgi:hypothetical protein
MLAGTSMVSLKVSEGIPYSFDAVAKAGQSDVALTTNQSANSSCGVAVVNKVPRLDAAYLALPLVFGLHGLKRR